MGSDMKKVLTIAGSDCSGGAGIQADLKTITAHKMYGMSVITAITAQNTVGVKCVQPIFVQMVEEQIRSVFEDIVPDAIKIGMLCNADIIKCVAKTLKCFDIPPIVLDPVFVSTSGHTLIEDDAICALKEELIPLATIITPNIPEAKRLSGMEINDFDDMKKSALLIGKWYDGNILIKGGHLKESDKATDLLLSSGDFSTFETDFIDNPNTHGTGCTLSSAIACEIADGKALKQAVGDAKGYLTKAINAKLDLGKGRGPLNHMVNL